MIERRRHPRRLALARTWRRGAQIRSAGRYLNDGFIGSLKRSRQRHYTTDAMLRFHAGQVPRDHQAPHRMTNEVDARCRLISAVGVVMPQQQRSLDDLVDKCAELGLRLVQWLPPIVGKWIDRHRLVFARL